MRRISVALLLVAGHAHGAVLLWQGGNALNSPSDVVASPDGSHLYATSLTGNSINTFARMADTGALVAVTSIGAEAGVIYPWRAHVSPDGRNLYVITLGSLHPSAPVADALMVFRRTSDGTLTLVESKQNGVDGISDLTLPSDVAVAPDGAQVYVRTAGSNGLLVFNRNASTGALTLLQTLRDSDPGMDGLADEGGLALSADSRHVYVTSISDDSLTVFGRDTTTGLLARQSTFHNGIGGVAGLGGAWDVALAPGDQHVYVAGSSDSAVALFSRDDDGELRFQHAYRQGDDNITGNLARSVDGFEGVVAVSVSPDGQRVYVSGQREGNPAAESSLAVLRRDSADGSLSFVEVQRNLPETPNAGLGGALRHTVSPDGAFLYSAGLDDDTIGIYSHSTSDLALTLNADAGQVDPGGELGMTLTVTNNSSGTAQGAAASVTLGSGVGLVSADHAGCALVADMLKCEFEALVGGEEVAVTLRITMPQIEGAVTTRAGAYSDYHDPDPANNVAAVDTDVVELTPNRPPVAVEDEADTLPGRSLVLDVLDNDYDEDGDTLSIVETAPEAGTLGSLVVEGRLVRYTPPAHTGFRGFTGVERFTYRISDGNGGEAESRVTIIVNTPPVAVNDTARVTQGDSVIILVLSNDSDADGHSLQTTLVDRSTANGGAISLNSDGSLTYRAATSYTGNDSFIYAIEDIYGARAEAYVMVQIQAAASSSVDPPAPTPRARSGGGGSFDMGFIMLLASLLLIVVRHRHDVSQGSLELV